MSNNKVLDKILNEIYEELYQRAKPKSSFKKLLKEAKWIDLSGNTVSDDEKHTDKWYREHGYRKDINYKNYVITEESMNNGINKVLDKYKKLTEKDVKVLMFNLSHGCGPLTEKEIKEENN